jgi:AraC-like DNA-binding protein
MLETYALHEGSFGRAVVLELRDDLVAHAHAETQLALWLGGARVEGHVGSQLVPYDEHMALGTNAYESHDARLLDKSGPAVFLCLYVAKAWLDDRRESSGRPFAFSSPCVPIDDAVRQSCWRVLHQIVSPQQRSTADIDQEVETLLLAAIASSTNVAEKPTLVPHAATLDHRIKSVIGYMREHVNEPLSAEDLAGKVNLSRAHLFSLFRDQLNTTPQVFWSAVRVEEAVRRLIHQEEPLTSVALDLGFSTPGNFSRFFREHMGVSPSKFRRVASGSQGPHLLTGVAP